MTTAPLAPCPVPFPTGQAPDVRPAHSLPPGERVGRVPALYAPDFGPVVAVLYYAGTSVLAVVNDGGRPNLVLCHRRYLQVIR